MAGYFTRLAQHSGLTARAESAAPARNDIDPKFSSGASDLMELHEERVVGAGTPTAVAEVPGSASVPVDRANRIKPISGTGATAAVAPHSPADPVRSTAPMPSIATASVDASAHPLTLDLSLASPAPPAFAEISPVSEVGAPLPAAVGGATVPPPVRTAMRDPQSSARAAAAAMPAPATAATSPPPSRKETPPPRNASPDIARTATSSNAIAAVTGLARGDVQEASAVASPKPSSSRTAPVPVVIATTTATMPAIADSRTPAPITPARPRPQGVKVQIGRINIEIHSPKPAPVAAAVFTAPANPPPPPASSAAEPFSASRHYLRG